MSCSEGFRRNINGLVLFFAFIFAPCGIALAAEDADWDRWKTHNPAETVAPDHSYFTKFLEGYGVVKRGEFALNYKAMKGKGVDFLAAYIDYLEGLPVSRLNRDEQLTYWLNLYNTGVIQAIASERRLPKRMNVHRGVPGSPGPMWSELRFKVEGYDLSLENIETNILSRHWPASNEGGGGGGAIWIYGLTWGVKGSPQLPGTAFYGNAVHAQLADSARSFIGRTTNVRVRKTTAELSSLYEWHRSLLGESDSNIINHIKFFADEKLTAQLDGATTISTDKFNWRVNSFDPGATSMGPVGGGNAEGGGGY